jgi:LemA protein
MKNKIIIGLLIGIAVVGIWLASSYNSLAKANIAVDTQWAQVEAQYQRRLDLIPNLVASVQGILTQEKEIFTAIAEARKGYAGARTVDEKAAAAGQVESALGRLLVITENYPQLTSNQTLQNLMTQLEGTENRVSAERGRFNETVGSFNSSIITFPTSIVASVFGFKERAFFKADVAAAVAPTVKFNQ